MWIRYISDLKYDERTRPWDIHNQCLIDLVIFHSLILVLELRAFLLVVNSGN